MFPIKKATPPLETVLSKQNPIMSPAFNVPTKATVITLAGTFKQQHLLLSFPKYFLIFFYFASIGVLLIFCGNKWNFKFFILFSSHRLD